MSLHQCSKEHHVHCTFFVLTDHGYNSSYFAKCRLIWVYIVNVINQLFTNCFCDTIWHRYRRQLFCCLLQIVTLYR